MEITNKRRRSFELHDFDVRPENHGTPTIAATAKPGEFAGKGVVAAKETSTTALPSAGTKNPASTGTTALAPTGDRSERLYASTSHRRTPFCVKLASGTTI
jgi:hypothetical protein